MKNGTFSFSEFAEKISVQCILTYLFLKMIWNTAWDLDEFWLADVCPDVLKENTTRDPHVISCLFKSTLKYILITQRSTCECWKLEKTWLAICVLKKLLINLSLWFANKMIEDNHVPGVLLTWVYYQARWVSMYPALNALSFLPSHRPAVKSKAKKEQTHKH